MPTRRPPADPKAKLLDALRKSPTPLTRSEVYTVVFKGSLPAREIDRITRELVEAGLLQVATAWQQKAIVSSVITYSLTGGSPK